MSQSNRSGYRNTRTGSSYGDRGRGTARTGRRPAQPPVGRESRTASNIARVSAARQGGRPVRRKKKPPYDIVKIIIGVIILALATTGVVYAVRTVGSGRAEESTEETTTEVPEPELQKEVMVDGITITGMSREEAREALMEKYAWGMKVVYGDQEQPVKNLMVEKIALLLEEIYSGEPREQYSLDTSGLGEAVKAEVAAIAAKWDTPAKNGAISGFDKEKGQFTYTDEVAGRVIDQEKLVSDIENRLASKDFKAVISASGIEVAPKITRAQAKEMYQVIGTYTTTTTSNKDRNTNIRLASDSLNGLILQPGEEFSFNKATGERSTAKGYRPAGAYLDGVLIEEPGGGVCQVSSTLYNAVVFAGLTTTERHAHSYEPSYVTPGEDAMVSYGGPDMKFVNNSTSAIAIRASFSDQKLKISIVGIPILEKGVTLSMSSKKTGELDPPAPVYEEDQTLQPGVEKVVIEAKKGSRWVTNLVTKKDGAVVSDELLHSSTYRGKPATIKRNTSGVVIPAETTAGNQESTEESTSGAGVGAETGAGTPSNPPETSAGTTAGPGIKPTQPARPAETPAATTGAGGPGQTQEATEPSTQPTTEPATQPDPAEQGVVAPGPLG